MGPQHRVPLMSGHRVDVTEAVRYLQQALGCDDWHVACHHEHQFIVHLTHAGARQYAVCFECNPPVEKAIYHGSLASAVFIVPMGDNSDPSLELLNHLKHGLEGLSPAPHPAAPGEPQPPRTVEPSPEPAHVHELGDRVKHWLHLR